MITFVMVCIVVIDAALDYIYHGIRDFIRSLKEEQNDLDSSGT